MQAADFHTGSALLNNAMKNLLVHWEATKETWNDATMRKFEEEHIETLKPKIRTFLETTARISEMLQRAEIECQ